MDAKTRATTELKTTGGHVVVLKSYITGREFNEIQAVYTDSAKVSVVGGVPHIDGFDTRADEKATHKLIELVVLSVDGNETATLDSVLDLPAPEYLEVVDKLNEISGKKKVENTSKQQ